VLPFVNGRTRCNAPILRTDGQKAAIPPRCSAESAAAFDLLWVLTAVRRRRGTTLASGRTAAPWRSPRRRVACCGRYGWTGCRWAQPQSSTRASGRPARGHLHEAVVSSRMPSGSAR
jgi:hypothetical protein